MVWQKLRGLFERGEASGPVLRVLGKVLARRSGEEAYAGGDQATLNRFLAPGASVSGLAGAVSFGSIASITVPPGGATRDITVTVNWVLYGQVSAAAPQLAATYDMSVIDKPGGRWYVREIRASTQPMGTQ